MQFADATKLNGVVMTSSPSAIPSARTTMWRPAVPLEQAIPSRRPASAATRASNRSVNGPIARDVLASTSLTSSISRGPMSGRASGIGWCGSGPVVMNGSGDMQIRFFACAMWPADRRSGEGAPSAVQPTVPRVDATTAPNPTAKGPVRFVVLYPRPMEQTG